MDRSILLSLLALVSIVVIDPFGEPLAVTSTNLDGAATIFTFLVPMVICVASYRLYRFLIES